LPRPVSTLTPLGANAPACSSQRYDNNRPAGRNVSHPPRSPPPVQRCATGVALPVQETTSSPVTFVAADPLSRLARIRPQARIAAMVAVARWL
jgi:hypothetical protein